MPSHVASLSLSGGEISPLLYNRVDLEKRASSLSLCENFLPLPYGGLRKRPGTRYLADVASAAGGDFLLSFRGSDGKRYLLTITTTAIIAYDIAAGTSHSITLNWGLTAADLPLVRHVVLNDVIFFTHPSIHPFSLRYTSATSWEVLRTQFTEDPELDQNLEEDATIAIVSNGSTEWLSGTTYTAGMRVTTLRDGVMREYTCRSNHTSASANQPGIGATWRNVWRVASFPAGTLVRLLAFPGIAAWSNASVAYRKGDYASLNGVPYRCRITHTSSASYTPGAETAVTIGTYWKRLTYPFSSLHAQGPGGSDNTFRPAARFSFEIRRDERSVTSELRAIVASNGQFSTPILISGAWNFNTFDTWSGIFTLQRSTDNGTTWEDIAQYESENDRNFAESFEEETAALIRVGFTSDAATAEKGQRRAVITPASLNVRARVADVTHYGPAELWGITQDLTMSGTTFRWSESAFNRRVGYPRAIAIHERRLYYAGTNLRPLDLWASRIEDFAYFRAGTKDDDPLKVTLGANSQNPILWLASQRRLYIGTRLSEWVIGSENNDNPITPTNFLARQYTTYGSSENVRPLLIGDSVIFLQRHDSRIREMGFAADRETYDSTDLTRLAEHLLLPDLKITAMAWQESREPTLWCVVSDGTLRALTYIRSERIFAWSRHTTQNGRFRAVAVSTNEATDDDVFFLVLRGSTYMLEALPSNAQILNESGPNTANTYLAQDLDGLNNDLLFTQANPHIVPALRLLVFSPPTFPPALITVIGNTITINGFSNFGTPTTLASAIKSAIEASPAASALVTVSYPPGNNGSGAITLGNPLLGTNYVPLSGGPSLSALSPAVYDSQTHLTTTGGTLTAQARWGGLGKYSPWSDSAARATVREYNAGTTAPAGEVQFIGGIPVIARVVTLPLEMQSENGPSLGRYKRASRLRACLFLGRDLLCATYLPNVANESAISYEPMLPTRETPDRYGPYLRSTSPAPALIAGWVESSVNLSSLNLSAELRHTAPTPCTITSLVIEAEISDS